MVDRTPRNAPGSQGRSWGFLSLRPLPRSMMKAAWLIAFSTAATLAGLGLSSSSINLLAQSSVAANRIAYFRSSVIGISRDEMRVEVGISFYYGHSIYFRRDCLSLWWASKGFSVTSVCDGNPWRLPSSGAQRNCGCPFENRIGRIQIFGVFSPRKRRLPVECLFFSSVGIRRSLVPITKNLHENPQIFG